MGKLTRAERDEVTTNELKSKCNRQACMKALLQVEKREICVSIVGGRRFSPYLDGEKALSMYVNTPLWIVPGSTVCHSTGNAAGATTTFEPGYTV